MIIRFQHILFLILLSLAFYNTLNAQTFPAAITAKIKALQKNKNISWIGETTVDFQLIVPDCDHPDNELLNTVRFVKLVHPAFPDNLYKQYDFDPDYWLTQQIQNDLLKGRYTCFQDAQLQEPIVADSLLACFMQYDTIVTSQDPYTYYAKSSCDLRAIHAVRLRLLLYYNDKKHAFGAVNLAFAPLTKQFDKEGIATGYKPIVWAIAPRKISRKMRKRSNYVMQTMTKDNSPGMATISTLKGNLDMYKNVHAEITISAQKCLNWNDFTPGDADILEYMLNPTYTIERLNPETYEVDTLIIHNTLSESLTHLRLVHLWYYDPKKHQLFSRLTATAPLEDMLDSNGKFSYRSPIYYRESIH